MSYLRNRTLFIALPLILMAAFCMTAAGQSHITGTLPDGATYVIDVPANWNGTLLLYSHGYVAPGGSNPAVDAGDPLTGGYLFQAGYALAGSSYATTGWAVHEALPDQIATLDVFESLFGTPTQTIAWGHSLGGIITAGLIQQYPDRFSAAMPMCGVLAGGVGLWNEALDAAFTFDTLVAGGALQVVDITNPTQNYINAESILDAAQGTPQGQARIALTAAMSDIPGWFDPASREPAPTDYATREANQYLWMANVDFPFAFAFRAELEGRAGGNPSWNTGVNYAKQLERSADNSEVQALYAAAGLSLDADLATLKSAAKIASDPSAEDYLIQNIIFNGQLSIPVLTLHTTGDGLVPVEDEQAYESTVHKAGNETLVRDLFIRRAGHCQFTPAETITAFKTLTNRMETGNWSDLFFLDLDSGALSLGATYNVLEFNGKIKFVEPEFDRFHSPAFLRPFDAFSK